MLFPFPVGCLAELPASSSPSSFLSRHLSNYSLLLYLLSYSPPPTTTTTPRTHFTPHIFLLPPLHILHRHWSCIHRRSTQLLRSMTMLSDKYVFPSSFLHFIYWLTCVFSFPLQVCRSYHGHPVDNGYRYVLFSPSRSIRFPSDRSLTIRFLLRHQFCYHKEGSFVSHSGSPATTTTTTSHSYQPTDAHYFRK